MPTAARDPWPKNRCPLRSATSSEVAEYEAVVGESATEAPLQGFLSARPHFLASLLPPGRDAWCFDRPRFGSELIPDFLLCTDTSAGFEWTMVELESPAAPILTQTGVVAAKLNQAQTQVRDWRAWLRQNIAYAQRELGFTDLNAECKSVIVIGRRSSIPAKHVKRYLELSSSKASVMTYDRLADAARRGRSFFEDDDEEQ